MKDPYHIPGHRLYVVKFLRQPLQYRQCLRLLSTLMGDLLHHLIQITNLVFLQLLRNVCDLYRYQVLM